MTTATLNEIMDLSTYNDEENGLLTNEFFPLTLKKLITPNCYGPSLYHEEFPEGFLPDCIQSITIHEGFSRLLKPGLLPKGLKELVIDMRENIEQEIDLEIEDGTLPPHLEILRVNTSWSGGEELGDFNIVTLPNSLRIIEFPDYFNFDGDLSSSLESIKFGTRQVWWWEKDVLPRSLKFVSNYFDNNFDCNGIELRFVWMQFKIIALLNHQTKKMKNDFQVLKKLESFITHKSSYSPQKRLCLPPLQNLFNNPYLMNDIYQYILPQREIIEYDLSGFCHDYAEPVFYFNSLKQMFHIDETLIKKINPSLLRQIDVGVYKLYLRDDDSCEIDNFISQMENDDFKGQSGFDCKIHFVFSQEELYT